MAHEHYSAFIKEAFVAPIRSVLIVDDDYPTFDEMLDREIAKQKGEDEPENGKRWRAKPERVKNVIANFRRADRSLLVDIHDGSNVDAKGDKKVASHLHQSDLLVLDYELDKTKKGDGSRAIEILRGLISNDHFNLVVVHTIEKLDIVFEEILIGLLTPSGDTLTEDEQHQIEEMIAEREDAVPDIDADLRDSIGRAQYIHSRLFEKTYQRTMGQGFQPYSGFSEIAKAAGWDNGSQKLLLRHLLIQAELPLIEKLSAVDTGFLRISQGAIKWIKSDSVFIAFSDKQIEDDPISALEEALDDWNPAPSRLFLAKLRAVMDEHGVVAQTEALERHYALAQWYERLLRANGNERRSKIAESVARQSDQLMTIILPQVEKFAKALVETEATKSRKSIEDLCNHHFGVDLSKPQSRKRAEREHNAFVCSTKPFGWHLSTGHIFSLADEYWVCLSPACDLVPGQGDVKNAAFGKRIPFMAVKLYDLGNGDVRDVNSNLFIFLDIDNNVRAFSFNSQSKEGTAPTWRLFYAESNGHLTDDFRFKLSVAEKGKRRLLFARHEVQIVAQLRYEYALNLLHKLGSSMTRIGLDFV